LTQKWVSASKGEMWQEGKEREGRSWVLQWNKEKPVLGNVPWRPEKGHLAPGIKVANEIAYDYVGDKLLPTRLHFYNLL
jgi:hypothetical protein